MVGGFIGVFLTGVFSSLAVNAVGASGGWLQFRRQSVLALAGLVFPFVMTLIILWITDKTVGLRVSGAEVATGLDMGEHAETAYEWPWETIQVGNAAPASAANPPPSGTR
jgi:Amt family ammonium transporter